MKDPLLRYLERERLAEQRAYRELRNLPLSERVECGEALTGLRIVSQGGGIYVVAFSEHNAKFREGDLLWIGDGGDVELGTPVRLITYNAAARTLSLEHDHRDETPPILPNRPLVLDRRTMELGERFAAAIGEVFSAKSHPVAACLEGNCAHDDDEAARRKYLQIARHRGLDRSQAEAFSRALARPYIHLIQGPPGTGKTRLIAEILDECLQRNERVAVVAYTHRAVDQVLARAAQVSGAKKVYKYDSSRANSPELAQLGVRKVASVDRLQTNREPFVAGLTTHAAARVAGRGFLFDRVIFDESGQIPIPHALASMRLGNRWIFVGDHAQLPPVMAGEHAREHSISIFEHLVNLYPSTMLETTWRMNDGICAFPSKHFYQDRLKPAPGVATRRIALREGGRFREVLDATKPAVLGLVDHTGAAMRSRREAALAAELLIEMIQFHGLPPGECAAVAPFRAQVMAIREQLEQRAARMGLKLPPGEPLVETVERIQGREREFVILSLASSDPDWIATQSDFYFLPNRLNVALTRARNKCIVLASPLAFAVPPVTLDDWKSLQIFNDLYETMHRVDMTPFESLISEQAVNAT